MQSIWARIAEDAEMVFAYRVRKGDTLHSIARKHGTTVSALLQLNGMKLQDPLYAGKILKIREEGGDERTDLESSRGRKGSSPASARVRGAYRVKKGDTIAAIAAKCGTTVAALLAVNRMKRTDTLRADQFLKLPADPSI